MSEKLATLSFSDGTPSVDFPIYSGSSETMMLSW